MSNTRFLTSTLESLAKILTQSTQKIRDRAFVDFEALSESGYLRQLKVNLSIVNPAGLAIKLGFDRAAHSAS